MSDPNVPSGVNDVLARLATQGKNLQAYVLPTYPENTPKISKTLSATPVMSTPSPSTTRRRPRRTMRRLLRRRLSKRLASRPRTSDSGGVPKTVMASEAPGAPEYCPTLWSSRLKHLYRSTDTVQ